MADQPTGHDSGHDPGATAQGEPRTEISSVGSAEEKTAPAPGTTAAPGSVLPAVPPTVPDTGYTAAGVPTLEGVREKIETRYGTAIGATELAEETAEGRAAAQRYEERQQAAAEKLEEIRASMPKKD